MNRRSFLYAAGAVVAVGVPTAILLVRDEASTGANALKLSYNAEEQPDEKSLLAQILQSQLNKGGITTTLEPVSSTVYNERIGKHAFEAALTLWYLDYTDPEGYLTDFYSKAGYRLSGYSNPAYDKAYEAALFAPDQAHQREAFAAAARIVDQDLVWLPLYSNNDVILLHPDCGGFQSNSCQTYDYRGVGRDDVRAATNVEVQTLDPSLTYDLASKHLVTQSYEGLVALDGANQMVPCLAESWRWSDDGKTLSFQLRQGVRFHPGANGAERVMAAADVKASFERTAGSASPYAYIFDHVVGIEAFRAKKATTLEGLKVLGDQQFAIHLSRPLPTMLQWLLAPAAFVLPAELPKDYEFGRGSRGTGPFMLRQWDGATARYEGHRAYWDARGRDYAKRRLRLSVLKDPSVQLRAFERGELDILNVPLSSFPAVLDAGGKLLPRWSGNSLRVVKLNNLKFIAFFL
jgi:ABC-type oligopeptide transport system substrate-binding subunit